MDHAKPWDVDLVAEFHAARAANHGKANVSGATYYAIAERLETLHFNFIDIFHTVATLESVTSVNRFLFLTIACAAMKSRIDAMYDEAERAFDPASTFFNTRGRWESAYMFDEMMKSVHHYKGKTAPLKATYAFYHDALVHLATNPTKLEFNWTIASQEISRASDMHFDPVSPLQ